MKTTVTVRTMPDTWVNGILHMDGREYPTMNPPEKKRETTHKAPPVEADVKYGPFVIRCYYTQARHFAPVRKLGYVLLHEDGWGWHRRVFKTVPDARSLGAEFAHSLNGIGGSPVAVVDATAGGA